MIATPLNRVVVGAPNAAAVPACAFAVLVAQLSADTVPALLDDELPPDAVLVLLDDPEAADDELLLDAVLALLDDELAVPLLLE